MLDQLDRDVIAWVAALPGIPEVVLQPPDDQAGRHGICLYMVDLRQEPAQRGTRRLTWSFQVRYLVTAHAPDPVEAHKILGAVLAAAIEKEDFDVDSDAPSLELWRALGAKPRPAFMLSVPWRHQRDLPQPPMVMHPLTIDPRQSVPLSGLVLGPEDTPVMAARVEIPELGLWATTDATGAFRFPSTPQGSSLNLRITARGKVIERSTPKTTNSDRRFLVRLEP
ncbi:MAG: Pvc16 family protein [Betaproteobacteria bacterium]